MTAYLGCETRARHARRVHRRRAVDGRSGGDGIAPALVPHLRAAGRGHASDWRVAAAGLAAAALRHGRRAGGRRNGGERAAARTRRTRSSRTPSGCAECSSTCVCSGRRWAPPRPSRSASLSPVPCCRPSTAAAPGIAGRHDRHAGEPGIGAQSAAGPTAATAHPARARRRSAVGHPPVEDGVFCAARGGGRATDASPRSNRCRRDRAGSHYRTPSHDQRRRQRCSTRFSSSRFAPAQTPTGDAVAVNMVLADRADDRDQGEAAQPRTVEAKVSAPRPPVVEAGGRPTWWPRRAARRQPNGR